MDTGKNEESFLARILTKKGKLGKNFLGY